jgi:hypothetical protein
MIARLQELFLRTPKPSRVVTTIRLEEPVLDRLYKLVEQRWGRKGSIQRAVEEGLQLWEQQHAGGLPGTHNNGEKKPVDNDSTSTDIFNSIASELRRVPPAALPHIVEIINRACAVVRAVQSEAGVRESESNRVALSAEQRERMQELKRELDEIEREAAARAGAAGVPGDAPVQPPRREGIGQRTPKDRNGSAELGDRGGTGEKAVGE